MTSPPAPSLCIQKSQGTAEKPNNQRFLQTTGLDRTRDRNFWLMNPFSDWCEFFPLGLCVGKGGQENKTLISLCKSCSWRLTEARSVSIACKSERI